MLNKISFHIIFFIFFEIGKTFRISLLCEYQVCKFLQKIITPHFYLSKKVLNIIMNQYKMHVNVRILFTIKYK